MSTAVIIRDPGVERSSPFWVLGVSGAVGFLLGAVVYPAWQVAVEPAQVIAGFVKYPPGNSFYLYETKLWTIVHQVAAVLLRAGLSEITLSKILSGVLAMVSLQSLAMTTYALSDDVAISIGAAVLVLVTRAASNGVNYPVMLTATTATYGSLGLSMFALVPALIGAGCFRTGAFLLGLMPAIHPSLGAWLWPIVGAAIVWDMRELGRRLRPALVWFVAGAAITVVSLLVQMIFIYPGSNVSAAASEPFLRAFIALWDGHRAAVDLNRPGVVLNELALVLAIIWLTGFTGQVSRTSRILLRVVLIAGIGSLGLAALTWIPIDRAPLWLLVLMPGRVLNFDAMIFAALLIGLAAPHRNRPAGVVLLIALLAALLLTERSMLWEQLSRHGWFSGRASIGDLQTLEVGALAVVLVSLWVWARPTCPVRLSRLVNAPIVRMVYAGVAMLFVTMLLLERPDNSVYFHDRTNDPFYAAIAAEPHGLVLTAGGFQLVQLYTRRPVLIYGALDTLPYAPESGPEMQRVLQDVYGLDLFNPPEEAKGRGALPREPHEALWEGNSPARWREISRRWEITQVLTPAAWHLQLPVAAETPAYRLYRIP